MLNYNHTHCLVCNNIGWLHALNSVQTFRHDEITTEQNKQQKQQEQQIFFKYQAVQTFMNDTELH
jgi:hypothetical protein